MFNLTNKTALITGASGGIGGAIAAAFVAQGAKVVLSGTNEAKLAALAAQLGSQAFILPCKLDNTAQTTALFDQAEALAGEISILVNNAGITKDTLAIRMKDADWDDVIKVNLTSTFLICRAAVKAMMRRRQGRIINITSIVAVAGNPGQVNYCASKAGMIGLSKALSLETSTRGITVNCIAPGFIETAMTDKLNEAQKTALLSQVPMQRMGTGLDIAAAAT